MIIIPVYAVFWVKTSYRSAIHGSEFLPRWSVSLVKLIPLKNTFFLLEVIHPFSTFCAAWSLAQTSTLPYANLSTWKSKACLLAIFKKNTHFRAIFLSYCLPRKHNGHLNFFPLPNTFLENVIFLAVLTSHLSMKHYIHYFFLLLKSFLCFWNCFFPFSYSLHQGVFFGWGTFSQFRITTFKHSESLLQQKVKRKTMWRNSTLGREMNLCSPLWACLQTAYSDRISPNQHISVSVMTPCPHMCSGCSHLPLRKNTHLVRKSETG